MAKIKSEAAAAAAKEASPAVPEDSRQSPLNQPPLSVGFESKAALLLTSEATNNDNVREETGPKFTFQDILSFSTQIPAHIAADEFYGPWKKYHERVGKPTPPPPAPEDDPRPAKHSSEDVVSSKKSQHHQNQPPAAEQHSPDSTQHDELDTLNGSETATSSTFTDSTLYNLHMKSLFTRTSQHDRQTNFRFYLFCTGIAPLLAFCLRALYEDGKHKHNWTKTPVIFFFSWFMTVSNMEKWPAEMWHRLPLTAFDDRLQLVHRQNDVLRTKFLILNKRIGQLQRIKEKITLRNQRIAAERAEAMSPASDFANDDEANTAGNNKRGGAGGKKSEATNKHNKTAAKTGGKGDARMSGIQTTSASGASSTAGGKPGGTATAGASATQRKGAAQSPSTTGATANLSAGGGTSAAAAKGGASATSAQQAKGAKPEAAAKKKK